MTYRTSAEPARSVVVRRIPSGDSFRWLKLVLGVLFVVGATIAAWVGTWSSVRCVDDRCAVVQWKMLRGAREYPFDPRSAPPIVLEPARVGKSGTGLRLLLRYPSGDVEILRDWPSQTEAEARRMRAYFADPRGALLVEGKRDVGPYLLVGILGLLGLLMALDGAKVLVWHRLRADPRAQGFQFELLGADGELARTPVVLIGQQGEQARHESHRQHPCHECGAAMLDAVGEADDAPGRRGDQRCHPEQDGQACPCHPLRRHSGQQPACQVQRAKRAKRNPLDPQRRQSEPYQPAVVPGGRKGQHQRQCLAGEHYGHQGGRAPEGIERSGGGWIQGAIGEGEAAL